MVRRGFARGKVDRLFDAEFVAEFARHDAPGEGVAELALHARALARVAERERVVGQPQHQKAGTDRGGALFQTRAKAHVPRRQQPHFLFIRLYIKDLSSHGVFCMDVGSRRYCHCSCVDTG